MKKTLILMMAAMFALSFVFVACGDDDEDGGGAACTEADVQTCVDDYTACTEALDVMSATYMDELQVCLTDYCDCLDGAGCDMSGISCTL